MIPTFHEMSWEYMIIPGDIRPGIVVQMKRELLTHQSNLLSLQRPLRLVRGDQNNINRCPPRRSVWADTGVTLHYMWAVFGWMYGRGWVIQYMCTRDRLNSASLSDTQIWYLPIYLNNPPIFNGGSWCIKLCICEGPSKTNMQITFFFCFQRQCWCFHTSSIALMHA